MSRKVKKEEMSEAKRTLFEEAFNSARPEDGQIPMTKITRVIEKSKYDFNEDEIEDALEKMGKSHTDTLTFDEFIEMVKIMEDPQNIFEAFQFFDKNNKGYITKDEFKYLLKGVSDKYTEEELDYIFQSTDINTDSKIKYKDFVKFWSTYIL